MYTMIWLENMKDLCVDYALTIARRFVIYVKNMENVEMSMVSCRVKKSFVFMILKRVQSLQQNLDYFLRTKLRLNS